MGDKIVEIQNQIRNNANSIRDYMDDLSNWESEMNQIDAAVSNKTYPLSEPPPIRSTVEVEETKSTPTLYKRDKTNMKDYYKAWENFNIDAEIEKLDDKIPKVLKTPKVSAPPQSKIVVKGGRSVNSEIDRLKDQGNLEFSAKEYNKALDKYQECLVKEVPNDVKVILFSNSAECFLRLKNPDGALDQAEKALAIDNKHAKSLLRRAKAKKMLGKFRNAKTDLEECLKIDPNNAAVKLELTKLEKKRTAMIEEAKAKMTNKSRPVPIDLISVPVQEINGTKVEEKKTDEKDLKAQTAKAIESISIDKLSVPKNLIEFERNWVMLNDKKKLRAYLDFIPIDQINAIFIKSSVESDFVMRIVNTFLENFTDFQDIVQSYLAAIVGSKKIAVLAKFLTKKEKDKIQILTSKTDING